jgi:hypothetical protein
MLELAAIVARAVRTGSLRLRLIQPHRRLGRPDELLTPPLDPAAMSARRSPSKMQARGDVAVAIVRPAAEPAGHCRSPHTGERTRPDQYPSGASASLLARECGRARVFPNPALRRRPNEAARSATSLQHSLRLPGRASAPHTLGLHLDNPPLFPMNPVAAARFRVGRGSKASPDWNHPRRFKR